MTTALPPAVASRLEKAALDNGFDQELPREGDWLGFASTQAPLRLWLSVFGDALFVAAFSQRDVARALGDYGTPAAGPLPAGAAAGRAVADIPALHRLVRRAFQLSRTLPDALLHAFEKRTAALPRTTEAERLVVQRIGQDVFGAGLIEYWEGRCAITGLAVPELLRASHIKPWADCASSPRPELVIGLVGAMGTDLEKVTEALEDALAEFRYKPVVVRLSELMRGFAPWRAVPREPFDKRIEGLQTAGNDLRAKASSGSAMAALGIAQIGKERQRAGYDIKKPMPDTAFILRSLKRPEEAALLRRIYGASFVLVAAYAPIDERRRHLARQIAQSWDGRRRDGAMARADELIQRDDHEQDRSHGQLVRDTFPLADVFVAAHRPDEATTQVRRFIDLVFGHPFQTPTRDEMAMFQARAVALRSADLSRQVGAVIATPSGGIVSVGTNEVPQGVGGQYWADSKPDGRDFQRGYNESLRIRRSMLAELLRRLRDAGCLADKFARGIEQSAEKAVETLMPSVQDSTFVGVAPRRYLEIFAMPIRERPDGKTVRFTRADATPRMAPPSGYIEAEELAVLDLSTRLERAGLRRATARGR